MSEKLPEKGELVKLDLFRIERNKGKDCTCEYPSYEIDTENVRVRCVGCGAVIDPFLALVNVAERHDEINRTMDRQREQKEEIKNYKPHLRIIKYLESQYRKKDHLLPLCPSCDAPFYLEELTRWTNRAFGDEMIAERKKKR